MESLIAALCAVNIVLAALVIWLLTRGADRYKNISKIFGSLQDALVRIHQGTQGEFRESRAEHKADMRALRNELGASMNQFSEAIIRRIHENHGNQLAQLDSFAKQLHQLTQMNDTKFEKLREVVARQLQSMQADNNGKLEEMRKTVDEKLNATLEKRLGDSFRLVSERLEQVHKGLGEMRLLATGVGDLKRVLSNVKTRGIWGEIQLGNLLEQMLTPRQYERNVATVPLSSERVEYAIKLPGRGEAQETVWLPIDAKFPQEDYQRLMDAQEKADGQLAEECAKALETRVKAEAKDIAAKYVAVPHTTEFAILFLPTEGLYAEILRRPGLSEHLMNKYKVVVAGPSTLAALLSSLQMGFRTIAIEERSAEVWTVLSAVKAEFGKFGDLLDKTHKKLQEASNSIDTAARKSRTIERKLKRVEEMPPGSSAKILALADDEAQEIDRAL